MTAVNGNPAELARRLTLLSERFARITTGLAEAGRDLLDRRILPAEALAEELAAVQADFEDLRGKVVAAAAALAGGAPPPITTIRELEVLVRALADRETARARRQAEQEPEDAQRRTSADERHKAEAAALHRLTEEEARRKAEAEAKRRSDEEAKHKAAEDAKRKAEEETKRKAEEEAKRKAEEEARRKAEEDARRRAEEEAKRKAEVDARRKAAEDAKRKADEDARRRVATEAQAQAQAKATTDARRKAEEEAKRRAEEAAREQVEARRRAEAETKRKTDEQARRQSEEDAARREAEEIAQLQAQEDARRRAAEQSRQRPAAPEHRPATPERRPAAPEHRPAAAEHRPPAPEHRPVVPEHRPVEPEPEPVAAAEDEGLDLGLETAQWWISASANWASLKAKQTAFPTAVHETLTKYPYVFSVPIQSSADYEDGLLAYGYAVLLDHVEQRRAGFVEGALSNLPTRAGASLGRRLYDYLAAALRDSYLEFVKTLMLAALPRSPLWVTGGIEDSDAATAMFTRPTAKIGDSTQKTDRATQDGQRFADRQFTVDAGPLTTRFFRVETGEVRDARTVEIKLAEKGAPSDQAWLVMVPRTGAAQARRHERQGTMISGMGKDYVAVWIGIFNTDAEADKRFDLTIGIRKRGATPTATSFRKPR